MRDTRTGTTGRYEPTYRYSARGRRLKTGVHRVRVPGLGPARVYGLPATIPVVHSVKPAARQKTNAPPHARGSRSVAPPRPQRHTPIPHAQLVKQTTTPRPPVRAPVRPPARRTGPPRWTQVFPGAPPVDPMQQFVDATVNPQLEALDRLEAFRAQQQQTATNAFNNLTGQYLGVLGQVPGQVQADYERERQSQLQAAQLSQQALAAANPNAQTQADLAAINAPEAQRQALAAQSQQVFNGGGATLLQTGGVIPANALATDEAARLAFARALPGIAQSTGTQALQSYLREQAKQAFDISNQRANVTAQIPKLRMDYQSQQASNRAKQQQLNLERAALGLRVQNQGFQQAATRTRLAQGQKSLQLRALQQDRQWQATLKRLGLQEANAKFRATQVELKLRNGGFTSSQLAKMKSTAYTIADQTYHGFTETDKSGNTISHRALRYGEAIREMLKEGIPLDIALRALNFYYPPGRRGKKH